MTRLPTTRIQRTAAIVALLVIATALCWLSWLGGSPLLDKIRDIDPKATFQILHPPTPVPISKNR